MRANHGVRRYYGVIFSVTGVDLNLAVTLVLRPLPFPGDRLVWITKAAESEGLSLQTYPVGVYEEFRRQSRSLDDLTAYFAFFGFGDAKLTGGGEAERRVTAIAGIEAVGITDMLPLDGIDSGIWDGLEMTGGLGPRRSST